MTGSIGFLTIAMRSLERTRDVYKRQINMSVGNRVFLQRELPDMELVKRYQRLPAANVADTMSRSCALNSEIHLISSPDRPIMAGPALTVKARPGDNLMLHKALDMAQEGDVIVVSNDGDRTHSLMGEIMAVYAQNKGKAVSYTHLWTFPSLPYEETEFHLLIPSVTL